MSQIDSRIVELQFNNKDFEQNAQDSLKTLETLDQKLNQGLNGKSFDSVAKAAGNLNLDSISENIEKISSKFSALGIIGITALQNITNSAINAGKSMLNSISFAQVSAGWDKYAQKTSAVQTIMAATNQTWEEEAEKLGFVGSQMEYVSEQMEKLNWFTDETSYNFVDMVSNIGKFTSNKIPLEQSVTAMQGISTWAAKSGANVGEASRAMYNLSQAISTGSVKLIDWKSIENANMSTTEFKDTVLETAANLGTLQKAGDGLYKTFKGDIVSASKGFNQSLQEGWFTSEVLLNTLDKYGSFTNKLHEVSEATELTATELLEMTDSFVNGSLDMEATASEVGISVEKLTGYLEDLGDEEMDFGRKAFQAAQEAKTFQEAIDATKDAVSTSWLKTFELIFGNYEEAKKLWTSLSNTLYDVFAEPINAQNRVLKIWNSKGGRQALFQGISAGWENILKIIEAVTKAYRSVFPAKDTNEKAKGLLKLTSNFRALMMSIGDSKGFKAALTGLENISKAVFKILSVFKQVGSAILSTSTFNALATLLKGVLDVLKLIPLAISKITDALFPANDGVEKVSNVFLKVVEVINTVMTVVGYLLSKMAESAKAFLESETGATIFGTALSLISGVANTAANALFILIGVLSKYGILDSIGQGMMIIGNSMKNIIIPNILKAAVGLGDLMTKLKTVKAFGLGSFLTKTTKGFKQFGTDVVGVANVFNIFSKSMRKDSDSIIRSAGSVTRSFNEISKPGGLNVNGITNTLSSVFGLIKTVTGSVANFLNEFVTIEKMIAVVFTGTAIGIWKGIGKFSNEFLALVKAIPQSILNVTSALNNIGKAITGVSDSFKILANSFRHRAIAEIIKSIAIAIGLLAVSLIALSFIDAGVLRETAISFGIFVGAILAAVGVLTLLAKALSSGGMIDSLMELPGLLVGLSVSVGILAVALKLLSTIEFEDPYKTLTVLGIALLEFVGAAILLSKFAGPISIGAIGLIALSVAIKILSSALKTIAESGLGTIKDDLATLSQLLVLLGAIGLAAGQIKLSSAVGVLIIAFAIEKFGDAFKIMQGALSSIDVSAMEPLFRLIIVFSIVHTVCQTAKSLKKPITILQEVGGLLLGAGAVLIGVGFALNALNNFDWSKIGDAIFLIGGVFGGIAGLLYLVSNKTFSENINKLKGFLIALSISISLLTLNMLLLSKIKVGDGMDDVLKAVALIFGGLAGVIFMMKGVDVKALKHVSLFMGMLTTILFAMTVLTIIKPESLIPAALAVVGALTALGYVFKSFASLMNAKNRTLKDIGYVLAMIGAIGAVAGAIYLLRDLKPENAIASVVAMSVLFMTLFKFMGSFSKFRYDFDIKRLKILAAGLATLGLVAGALWVVSRHPWDQIAVSVIAIGATFAILYKFLENLKNLKNFNSKMVDNLKAGLISLAAVAAALWVVSLHPWDRIGAAVLGMAGVFGILYVFINLLSKMKKGMNPTVMASLQVSLLSLIAVAGALFVVSRYNWADILASMVAISGVLLALSGVILLLSRFGGDGGKMIIAAAAIDVASISLIAMAYALKQVAEVKADNIIDVALAFGILLGTLTIAVAVLGAVGPVSLIGAIALIGIGAAVLIAAKGMEIAAAAFDLFTIAIERLGKALPEIGSNLLEFLVNIVKFVTVDSVLQVVAFAAAISALGIAGFVLLAGIQGLFGLSAALEKLTPSLETLASIPLITVSVGLVALGAAMFVISLLSDSLMTASEGLLAVSIGILKLGEALSVFTPAADKFTGLDPLKIAGGLLAIGLTATVMSLLAPAVVAAAVAFGLLGVSLMSVGAGVSGVMVGLDLVTKFVDGLMVAGQRMAEIGTWFVQSFVNGILNMITAPFRAAAAIGKAAEEGLRDATKIHSESPIFNDIGGWVVKSFANGAIDLESLAETAGSIIGNATGDGLLASLDSVTAEGKAKLEGLLNDAFGASIKIDSLIGRNQARIATTTELSKKMAKSLRKDFKDGYMKFDEFGNIIRTDKERTNELTDAFSSLTDGLGGVTDGLGGAGGAAKSAGKDIKDLSETIYESVEGAMSDPFAKMELKAEISKQDLLKNMESQLTAVASWSAKLSELGEKGVSEGLLKYLAELGPQGYQYVHAFSTMTLEEIAKANQLYTAQLAMPAAATAQIKGSFEKAGIDVGDGFLNAMKEKGVQWNSELKSVAEQGIEGAAEGFGTRSPSWKTKDQGINVIKGFILGLDQMLPSLKTKIWEICTEAIERFREMLAKDKFVEIGIDVIKGIIDGMESTDVLTSVEKVADNIYTTIKNELAKSKFESIGKDIGQGLIDGMKSMEDAVLKAGSGIGKIALKGTKSGAQTKSPSKFTTKVGKYIGDGLIVGMRARESAVEAAAENLSRSPLDILKDTINGIYSGLGRDDFNPVITPILDLSDVKDKASTLQKLLSDREIAINRLKFSASGVGTDLNAQNGQGNTINYTQNNYSPKALSTYDIYRQTRNQLSTVKGAIGLS